MEETIFYFQDGNNKRIKAIDNLGNTIFNFEYIAHSYWSTAELLLINDKISLLFCTQGAFKY